MVRPRLRHRKLRRLVTTDPVEVEATGQLHVLASYKEHEFKVLAAVDDWPLDQVVASLGLDEPKKKIRVHHAGLFTALQLVLGDQWPAFCADQPRRGELVALSHALATAVGFPQQWIVDTGNPLDEYLAQMGQVFGAIPLLLTIVHMWPDKVESDLDRFWGLDYRDRWRFDAEGQRRLTLRQIHARITNLPADSALAIAMGKRTPVELLLMDLYEPIAHQAHPERPLRPEQVAERRAAAAKLERERELKADYRRRRGAGRKQAGIEVARENAQQSRKAAHAQESSPGNPEGQAGQDRWGRHPAG